MGIPLPAHAGEESPPLNGHLVLVDLLAHGSDPRLHRKVDEVVRRFINRASNEIFDALPSRVGGQPLERTVRPIVSALSTTAVTTGMLRNQAPSVQPRRRRRQSSSSISPVSFSGWRWKHPTKPQCDSSSLTPLSDRIAGLSTAPMTRTGQSATPIVGPAASGCGLLGDPESYATSSTCSIGTTIPPSAYTNVTKE